MNKIKNIQYHNFTINRKLREEINNQSAKCIFFTGLSGSGKSTFANELECYLTKLGFRCYILDGDNIRTGINNDLSFSQEDRSENLRRIAEIAKLFIDAGIITICTFIAPLEADRQLIKEIIGEDDFYEIYIKASLNTCIKRDPKGLYKKALNNEIKNFTGIHTPYEIPKNPFYIIDTEKKSIKELIQEFILILKPKICLQAQN